MLAVRAIPPHPLSLACRHFVHGRYALLAFRTRTQMLRKHFRRGRRCAAGISDADADAPQAFWMGTQMCHRHFIRRCAAGISDADADLPQPLRLHLKCLERICIRIRNASRQTLMGCSGIARTASIHARGYVFLTRHIRFL